MSLLQMDPTTNKAERICFMALVAATLSFGIQGARTLGSHSHLCAGFNPEAKMGHYSATAFVIGESLGFLSASYLIKSLKADIIMA